MREWCVVFSSSCIFNRLCDLRYWFFLCGFVVSTKYFFFQFFTVEATIPLNENSFLSSNLKRLVCTSRDWVFRFFFFCGSLKALSFFKVNVRFFFSLRTSGSSSCESIFGQRKKTLKAQFFVIKFRVSWKDWFSILA